MSNVINMPPKKGLVDGQGRKVLPTAKPLFEPPEGWDQNPDRPEEYVRVYQALAISVLQNTKPGLPPAVLAVLNLAENKAVAHAFQDAASAFAFADMIFGAVEYEMVIEPGEEDPENA